MPLLVHHDKEKPLLFMLIFVGYDERIFSLHIIVANATTLIVKWIKDFTMTIISLHITITYCIL